MGWRGGGEGIWKFSVTIYLPYYGPPMPGLSVRGYGLAQATLMSLIPGVPGLGTLDTLLEVPSQKQELELELGLGLELRQATHARTLAHTHVGGHVLHPWSLGQNGMAVVGRNCGYPTPKNKSRASHAVVAASHRGQAGSSSLAGGSKSAQRVPRLNPPAAIYDVPDVPTYLSADSIGSPTAF